MSKEQDRIELNKWLITKGIESEKIRKIICKRSKNPKLIPTEGFEDSSNSWWWEDSPEGKDFWDNVNNVLQGFVKLVYPTHIYDLSDYINVKFDTYFYTSTSGKFVNVLGEEIVTPKNKIQLTTSSGDRVYFNIEYIVGQLAMTQPKFAETYTSDGEKVSCPKENEIQQGSPVKEEKIAGYVVDQGKGVMEYLEDNEVYPTINDVMEEYSVDCLDDSDVYTIYKLVPVATIRKVSEIKVETL